MSAIVTAQFVLGGKNVATRAELNQIIQLLGIRDPEGKLPVGETCRYLLVLQGQEKVPKECAPRERD